MVSSDHKHKLACQAAAKFIMHTCAFLFVLHSHPSPQCLSSTPSSQDLHSHNVFIVPRPSQPPSVYHLVPRPSQPPPPPPPQCYHLVPSPPEMCIIFPQTFTAPNVDYKSVREKLAVHRRSSCRGLSKLLSKTRDSRPVAGDSDPTGLFTG